MAKKTKKKKSVIKKPVQKQAKKKAIPDTWPIWLMALLIFLIAFVIRIYAFSMPVVGDEAVYGILGKKAMMGKALYKDIYEMKPPLLFYAYGLANSIFGWGTWGLRLTGLLIVLTNSFLIYKLARQFSSLPISLLIGATSLFFQTNLYAYAVETTSELFYMIFVLSGFLVLSKPRRSLKRIFLAGFLICGAAMIKQTAALFGMAAILFLILSFIRKDSLLNYKELLRQIGALALGAFLMISLNLLPIAIYGTWHEAWYWLIEVPSKYSSSLSFTDSLQFLNFLGLRILKYQLLSLSLGVIGCILLLTQYKKSYFPLVLILVITSAVSIIPGFRYYSQYWLPLLIVLPLTSLVFLDIMKRFKIRETTANFMIGAVLLLFVLVDTFTHSERYFEKGYTLNAESAYNATTPSVYLELTRYLKKYIQPGQNFLMLGSMPFTYYAMEQLPISDHIYPRIISRETAENKSYQEQAIQEMKNGNYSYVLYSVTGLGWFSTEDYIDDWYTEAFRHLDRQFEPLVAYNFDQKKYTIQGDGVIDITIPNQVILFRKKG